ncbi:MAG: hypothetical protein KDD11_00715, partial [Acidobacteria bacterium]|nr:hypothetical protein [Acidobacteriota bacterium]
HFCSMCGPKFCSMEITRQLRDYAAERKLEVSEAVSTGLAEKAEQYRRERLAGQGRAGQEPAPQEPTVAETVSSAP